MYSVQILRLTQSERFWKWIRIYSLYFYIFDLSTNLCTSGIDLDWWICFLNFSTKNRRSGLHCIGRDLPGSLTVRRKSVLERLSLVYEELGTLNLRIRINWRHCIFGIFENFDFLTSIFYSIFYYLKFLVNIWSI